MSCETVCLRRLAHGHRHGIVGFSRFLANPRVTLSRLIDGWGAAASEACSGRHVLAIQDTSEFNFRTTEDDRRGLGAIGKGVGRGLLMHAMLGVDAGTGALLGLVTGRIWTRSGRAETPHEKRRLPDKESERWLGTGEAAKSILSRAAMVTEVSDRESDFFARWARLPGPAFHLLGRAMSDRAIVEGGGRLSSAPLKDGGERIIAVRARPGRAARQARLVLRFGRVSLKRPKSTVEPDMPAHVGLGLVEVREVDAPAGVEPILWRLLTTHALDEADKAWEVVGWYRRRWIVEQFFRTLKQQGLRMEDSQVETADRLLKLTAIAARAACIILQLVQARDGQSDQPAAIAFTPAEVETLQALVPKLEGRTSLQQNHHPPASLAWAAWIIAKLGGWDGYPKSKPPGPITFRNGLERFKHIATGWSLRVP